MKHAERQRYEEALQQCLNFYNKSADQMQLNVWWYALQHYTLEEVRKAFADYCLRGRYSPKPVEIIELIKENREHTNLGSRAAPEPLTTDCPPEIAKAWSWYLGVRCQGSNLGGLFSGADVPGELQEKYLHLVNHEARVHNQPEAIDDEHKLREVWG